jgi:hypothetical protein
MHFVTAGARLARRVRGGRWITCFVSVLPLDEASLLWDHMVTHGMSTLVAFTLSLLALLFKTHSVRRGEPPPPLPPPPPPHLPLPLPLPLSRQS